MKTNSGSSLVEPGVSDVCRTSCTAYDVARSTYLYVLYWFLLCRYQTLL